MRFYPCILVFVALTAVPCVGQEKSWVGKSILTKKPGIQIIHIQPNGMEMVIATLSEVHFKVMGDLGDRIQVQTNQGVRGWFEKAQAVLLEDAENYFTARLQQNPKELHALSMRAAARTLRGDLDLALKDFDEVIKRNPTANHYNNRAIVWARKKDFDQSIADSSEAIRLDPKNVPALNHRGFAWAQKKDFDKAIIDYSEAIRLDPKNVHGYNNRGFVWLLKKEFDKGIADFNQAILLDARLVPAYSHRAQAWSKKKEYDKALADYRESCRLDPKNPFPLNAQAWILATCPEEKIRDGKKAVELARQAVALAPKHGAYLDTLAAAYAEAGNFEEAVRSQERALEDPQFRNEDGARQRLEVYRQKKPYRQE